MTEGQADDLIIAIRGLTDTIEQQAQYTNRRLDQLNHTMQSIAMALDELAREYHEQRQHAR